jgi:hypothetical protein
MLKEDWVPLIDPMPSHRVKFLKNEGNGDGLQGRILGLFAAIFIISVFRRQIGDEVPTLSIAEPKEGQHVVAEELFLDTFAVLVQGKPYYIEVDSG